MMTIPKSGRSRKTDSITVGEAAESEKKFSAYSPDSEGEQDCCSDSLGMCSSPELPDSPSDLFSLPPPRKSDPFGLRPSVPTCSSTFSFNCRPVDDWMKGGFEHEFVPLSPTCVYCWRNPVSTSSICYMCVEHPRFLNPGGPHVPGATSVPFTCVRRHALELVCSRRVPIHYSLPLIPKSLHISKTAWLTVDLRSQISLIHPAVRPQIFYQLFSSGEFETCEVPSVLKAGSCLLSASERWFSSSAEAQSPSPFPASSSSRTYLPDFSFPSRPSPASSSPQTVQLDEIWSDSDDQDVLQADCNDLLAFQDVVEDKDSFVSRQSFVEYIASFATSVYNAIVSVTTTCQFPDVLDLLSNLCKSFSPASVGQWARSKWQEVLHAAFSALFPSSLPTITEVIFVVAKTIIRWWFGYSPHQLMMELAFDDKVLNALGSCSSFLFGSTGIFAQSPDPIVGVASVLGYLAYSASGISPNALRDFVSITRVTSSVLPASVSGSLMHMPVVGALLAKSTASLTFAENWPHTAHYISLLSAHDSGENIPYWKRSRLLKAWCRSRTERLKMSPSELSHLRLLGSAASAPTFLGEPIPTDRKKPIVIYLYGLPGQGKTVAMKAMTQYLHLLYKKRGWIDPQSGLNDFIWTYASGMKHCDGYRGQHCVIMNDFLSAVETPSDPGDTRFLLQAADEQNFLLPMARLEEKGMILDPEIIIVTSNIQHSSLSSLAKSMNNGAALLRRITHYYSVEARTLEENVFCFTPGHSPHDQWNFSEVVSLTENPHSLPAVPFVEVLRHAVEELTEWHEQTPPHRQLDPAILDALDLAPCLAQEHQEAVAQSVSASVTNMLKSMRDFALVIGMSAGEGNLGPLFGQLTGLGLPDPAGHITFHDDPPEDDLTDWYSKYVLPVPPGKYVSVTAEFCQAHKEVRHRRRNVMKVFGLAALGVSIGYAIRRSQRPLSNSIDSAVVKESRTIKRLVLGDKTLVRTKLQATDGTSVEAFVPVDSPAVAEALNLEVIQRKQSKLTAEDMLVASGRREKWVLDNENSVGRSMVDLYSGSDLQKVRIGAGFCVSHNEVITAAHVARKLHTGHAILTVEQGNRSFSFVNTPGDQDFQETTQFTVWCDRSLDLAVIFVDTARLQFGKSSHFSKLAAHFESGKVKRLGSDVKAYAKAPQIVVYSDGGQSITSSVHEVKVDNRGGLCGTPYLLDTPGGVEIVGVHVAGKPSEKISYFVPITQTWLLRARRAGGFYPVSSPAIAQGDGKYDDLVESAGFVVAGKSYNRTRHPVVSTLVEVPELIHSKGFFARRHALSPLQKFVRDGVVVDPIESRLQKCGRARLEGFVRVHKKAFVAATEKMSQIVPQLSFFDEGGRPLWQKLVASDNEHDWKSVDRTKSAGSAFPGESKMLFFDPSEETPTLTPEAVKYLDAAFDLYMRGEYGWEVSGACLKDEKLPLKKAAQGATRLFYPEDFGRLMLTRLFYGPALASFNARARDCLDIFAASTPEDIASCWKDLEEWRHLGTDVASQDNSHKVETWRTFFLLALASGWIVTPPFFSSSPKARVHPDMPELNAYERAAWFNLLSCALTAYNLGDTLFYMPGAVGSGMLLTFLFNCVTAFYINCIFKCNLRDRLGAVPSSERALLHRDIESIRFFSFGDDQNTSVPQDSFRRLEKHVSISSVLIDTHRSSGYRLTAPDKSGNFAWTKLDCVEFCGRNFVRNRGRPPTMALTEARLAKSVQYVRRSSPEVVLPGQICVFLQELNRYSISQMGRVMSDMSWYSQAKLTQFVGSAPAVRSLIDKGKLPELETLCADWVAHRYARILHGKASPVTTTPPPPSSMAVAQGDGPGTASNGSAGAGPVTEVIESATNATVILPGPAVDDLSEAPTCPRMADVSAPSISDGGTMSRMVQVGTIVWTVATASGTQLSSFAPLSTYLSQYPNGWWKLANHVMMGGKVVIDAQLSASNFSSGALVMTANPKARAPLSVEQAMSGPHVKIIAGSAQSGRIEVPFMSELLRQSVKSYGDLSVISGSTFQSRFFDFVECTIWVLRNLKSEAAQPARLAVWVSFDDVLLTPGGLTSHPPAAQGEAERLKRHTGPLLKTMGGVAEAASSVGKVVKNPTFQDGVATMTTLAAFSKPVLPQEVVRALPTPGSSMASGSGVDASMVLAIGHDQQGVCPPEMSELEDPMAVTAVASRWGYLDLFTWSEIDPWGSELWGSTCLPSTRSPKASAPLPPCSYVAHLHLFERGTVRYRLTCIKAPQHAGALVVQVDYNGITGYATDIEGRSAVLHRVQWNIAERPVIEVEVPWIHPTHFLPINSVVAGFTAHNLPRISIRVANVLTRPDTVSNDIEILVEVCSPDLMVAWPYLSQSAGPAPLLAPKGKEKEPARSSQISAQAETAAPAAPSGLYDPSPAEHSFVGTLVILGPKTIPFDRSVLRQYYMGGEIIDSLSTLIRRFYFVSAASHTAEVWQTLHDPNVTATWPAMLRQLTEPFIFGYGGVRYKACKNEKTMLLAATANNTSDTPNPAEPNVMFVEVPSQLAEVQIPTLSEYPIYVLRNDQIFHTRLVIQDSGVSGLSSEVMLFMSMADDARFFGQNYLPASTAAVPAYREVLPAPHFT